MNMTSEEAIRNLSVPCLLLQLGAAGLRFPGSDRCSPAPYVQVVLVDRSKAASIPTGCLPVKVSRDQWETCVVPVLEVVCTDVTNPLSRGRRWEYLSAELGKALGESFRLRGW